MQNEGFLPFGRTNDAVQIIIGPTRQHSGSRLARSPRIGNPVSGKFRVDL